MKRPFLLIGILALLSVPAIIFYLDWRIPRATATIQIHPDAVVGSSHSGMAR